MNSFKKKSTHIQTRLCVAQTPPPRIHNFWLAPSLDIKVWRHAHNSIQYCHCITRYISIAFLMAQFQKLKRRKGESRRERRKEERKWCRQWVVQVLTWDPLVPRAPLSPRSPSCPASPAEPGSPGWPGGPSSPWYRATEGRRLSSRTVKMSQLPLRHKSDHGF